jgi:hypothetical protein
VDGYIDLLVVPRIQVFKPPVELTYTIQKLLRFFFDLLVENLGLSLSLMKSKPDVIDFELYLLLKLGVILKEGI